VKLDYLTGSFKEVSPAVKAVAKTPPPFGTDPWGYLTHPDNRLQTAVGGLGIASAMGAFDPKTGLNLPPRTYQRVNTSYNPGTVNPKYGMPGEPYFVGQGYGPETRETYYGAAGGGIRALSTGGPTAPYVPMTARGKMSWREDVPTDLDDSAAFKRYLKSDINKKEEKGQAEIDANVMAWLERYAKADVKGMAEGGPAQQVTQFQPTYSPAQQGIGSLQPYQAPNVPAMNSQPQQPQYQMSDFTNSPLFQQTQTPPPDALNNYLANLGQSLMGSPQSAVDSPQPSGPFSINPAAIAPFGPGARWSFRRPRRRKMAPQRPREL
jgi:hypothetical protein